MTIAIADLDQPALGRAVISCTRRIRVRFMNIAREASVGGTVRESLRRQINDVSRELAMLEDLAAREPDDTTGGTRTSVIQTARASALQTQLTDKRAQLESLIERERTLGPEKARETSPASLAAWRPRPVRSRIGVPFRLIRSALLWALATVVIVSVLVVLSPLLGDIAARRIGPFGASPKVVTIDEVVPAITGPVGDPGESIFFRDMTVSYVGGQVVLSGQPYPSAIAMDDRMEITVVRSDGSTSTWTHPVSEDCGANELFPLQDVTHLFDPGLNIVRLVLYDRCGESRGASGPVVLSNQQ